MKGGLIVRSDARGPACVTVRIEFQLHRGSINLGKMRTKEVADTKLASLKIGLCSLL